MPFVGIGGALYLGLRAQSEVRISLTNVTATVGPCDTPSNPSQGAQVINDSLVLTNSGSRDGYAIVYLYGNGAVLGRTGPIRVNAGKTVPDQESATLFSCGPVAPTAVIHSVSLVP